MLLVHTQKVTPRLDYAFKHICTRILGIKVEFTSVIENFIQHQGLKLSYGKQPIGNEFFIQANGLLWEQGFEDVEITISEWEESICFFSVGERSDLPFDIFSAAFYLLSRYEEYLPHVKDELGRFPAKESLAYKKGFLQQPVVDQWAYKFSDILFGKFPEEQRKARKLTTHHLIDASRPFRFAQRGPLRNTAGYFRDLAKFKLKRVIERSRVLLKLRKDPYNTFTWIINNLKNSEVRYTMFFLIGEAYTFRESLNTKREKFRMLVKYVADYAEVGLTLSFHSLDNFSELKNEKRQMEELTHRQLKSTIIDKSLLALPHNYRNLIELEVERDFSMFYEHSLGFRGSTCTPFLFYDLDFEVKTPLVIHPVIGRTDVLEAEKSSEIERVMNTIKENVNKVNGTFSLLYSNKDFVSNKSNRVWRHLFSEN
ncbi:MAG: hypothetical protein HKN48_02415 [Flavobacteriaceae bacterium]|nr:hypothetical protein [Flavobacteriaceae bacterium]